MQPSPGVPAYPEHAKGSTFSSQDKGVDVTIEKTYER